MKVIVCENYDEMSAKAFEVMKELLDAKKDAVLGLATGSSPVGLYKEMIQYHKDGYSYKDIKSYNLDDLDVPWRPSDLEQRAGRIVRQGNENEKVNIYRYVTENTFDAYLWVRHEVA